MLSYQVVYYLEKVFRIKLFNPYQVFYWMILCPKKNFSSGKKFVTHCFLTKICLEKNTEYCSALQLDL